MPWRFLDDFPIKDGTGHARQQPEDAFVLSYMIWKLGGLELAIHDLESSADAMEDYLALRRLAVARERLAAAADEVIRRRSAAVA